MTERPTLACRAALTAALLLSFLTAEAAITEGRTADGRRYVTGGVGSDEVATLQDQAAAYSLQLITAARGGAYLAGAHLRIVGPGNNVVLDTTVDAPWLLIDLPSGRYTVRARHSGETVERALTITTGKPQRVVLHFNAPVDRDAPVAPRAERAEPPAPPSPMPAPSAPVTTPSVPSPPPTSAPTMPPPPPPPPPR